MNLLFIYFVHGVKNQHNSKLSGLLMLIMLHLFLNSFKTVFIYL